MLKFLRTLPKDEVSKYWFSHNFRFQRANGDWTHIVQQATVLEKDEFNIPLIVFGICYNVTSYKTDSRIIWNIYKSDEETG